MSVAVLLMTDGREEYLGEAIMSAKAALRGPISEWWMHDDTGNDQYRLHLRERFPEFTPIWHGQRRGFGGAIAYAWEILSRYSHAGWVFHVEQDFTFTRAVNLTDMIEVMEANPHIMQMALRRQAWNDAEKEAGGVVELNPESFASRQDMLGRHWLEHRLFWTTNPSLYRRSTVKLEWPAGPRSEGTFTHRLLRDPNVRLGYWGSRDSGTWVEHIGQYRKGKGY